MNVRLPRFLAVLAIPAVLASCSGAGEENGGTPAPEPQLMEGGAAPQGGEAGFEAELEAMREQLGEGFEISGKFPFAVGGNLSEQDLARFVDGTIATSYEAFYAQFFEKRPTDTIRVYLFDGEVPYRENARRLWGDDPSTKYGYYMRSRRALIMNIRTGGGTLIHEMVHALMEYDFPDAPTWFDEGMGSLFEQCSLGHGRIKGLENWRLPILKKGIAAGKNPPLRELMATTRAEFLDENSSLHYAQARYFCLYLQDNGFLEAYYHAYRDRFDEDPAGVLFAEELFEKPLEEVEKEWLPWVDRLRWRGR